MWREFFPQNVRLGSLPTHHDDYYWGVFLFACYLSHIPSNYKVGTSHTWVPSTSSIICCPLAYLNTLHSNLFLWYIGSTTPLNKSTRLEAKYVLTAFLTTYSHRVCIFDNKNNKISQYKITYIFNTDPSKYTWNIT